MADDVIVAREQGPDLRLDVIAAGDDRSFAPEAVDADDGEAVFPRQAGEAFGQARLGGDGRPGEQRQPKGDEERAGRGSRHPAIWVRRMCRVPPWASLIAKCRLQRLSQKAIEPARQRKRQVNSGRRACAWR